MNEAKEHRANKPNKHERIMCVSQPKYGSQNIPYFPPVVSPTFILEITKLVTPTVVSWLLVWPGLEILIVIVKVGITHEGTKAVDECIIVELGPHGLSTVRL